MKAKKPSTTKTLDAIGIDAICERITSGESQASIAISLSINTATLSLWLSDPKRSARAREARTASAQHWDTMAEQVLRDADVSVNGSVAVARELASHYRWRAKCYDNKNYGEKMAVEAAVTVSGLTDEQLMDKAKKLSDKLGL